MTDTLPRHSDPRAAPADHLPAPGDFSLHPPAWFPLCAASELTTTPRPFSLLGLNLVAFRTAAGQYALLDSRCSHLGADLAQGTVHGDCLRCPFHHWQYAADGRCTHIPAQSFIPPTARQRSYPLAAMGPWLFFFNGPEPLYDLPFFADQEPAHFTPAPPFFFTLDCPWFLVGANAFDEQHFLAAHDRRLESPTVISSPTPFAHRAESRFEVVGHSLEDRLTRLLSGRRLTMISTDYAGSLIFVTARFRRTTSFGMVSVRALEPHKTLVTGIVWVPKSRRAPARLLLDPLHARIRRHFIYKFLEPDSRALQGCRYRPARLIEADRQMGDYLRWLAPISRGIPQP